MDVKRAVPGFVMGALITALLLGCGGATGRPPADGDPPDPAPGPASPPSTPPVLEDGFEAGFGVWSSDAQVPPSVEDPTVPVPWSIDLADERVHGGAASVRLRFDGRQDDGTIWQERSLPVESNTVWDVHVSAASWSESESFNTTAEVALYAGAVSPEGELDFDVSGVLNQVPGWKVYGRTFEVTSAADGLLHIGVGVNVVWETWITYCLDDARVWVEPR